MASTHARAHLSYEEGDPHVARAFLGSWLSTSYPRNGLLYSHLSWHLALAHLEVGDAARTTGNGTRDFSGPRARLPGPSPARRRTAICVPGPPPNARLPPLRAGKSRPSGAGSAGRRGRARSRRTSSLLPTANRMVPVSLAIQILTTKCDRSSVGSARLIFQKIVIRLLTARPITGRWLIRDYKTRPLWQVQSKFEFGPAHDEPALLAIYQTRDVVVSRQLCDPVVGR